MQFSKTDVACLSICYDLLLTKCFVEHILKTAVNLFYRKKLSDKNLLKEVSTRRVSIFWKKSSARYDFIEIYKIFSVTNSKNIGCYMRLE